MGLLANLFFGKSDAPAQNNANGDAELPKQVKEWNLQGTTQPHDTRPMAEQAPTPAPNPPAPTVSTTQRKIIPELDCTHVDPHVSADGKTLELWLTLQNKTPNEIEIRNMTILNQKYGMNQFYKPGESREIKVFQGATPLDYHANKATVQLKIVENDDYFEADFITEFHQEDYPGLTVWVPEELKPIHPIRDI